MGENIWLRWWCRRINIKGDGISVTAAQITGVTPCFSECRRYIQLRRLHRITLLFWLGAAHKKKMKMLLCDCSSGWRNESAVIKSACKCIQASRRHIDFSISDWLCVSLHPPPLPLFFREPCEMLALEDGGVALNWWCHTMKKGGDNFSAGTFYPFSVTILLTCKREQKERGKKVNLVSTVLFVQRLSWQ